MLDHLGWETLEQRRNKLQLVLFYKIVNNLVDIPANKYLDRPARQTRSGHTQKFRQIQATSDFFKHSFFPHTILLWNSLPASIAEAPDLITFKRELATFSLE
jgi:hypothetical protein